MVMEKVFRRSEVGDQRSDVGGQKNFGM